MLNKNYSDKTLRKLFKAFKATTIIPSHFTLHDSREARICTIRLNRITQLQEHCVKYIFVFKRRVYFWFLPCTCLPNVYVHVLQYIILELNIFYIIKNERKSGVQGADFSTWGRSITKFFTRFNNNIIITIIAGVRSRLKNMHPISKKFSRSVCPHRGPVDRRLNDLLRPPSNEQLQKGRRKTLMTPRWYKLFFTLGRPRDL